MRLSRRIEFRTIYSEEPGLLESPPLRARAYLALPGMQVPQEYPSFKLVIVGDGGTGAHLRDSDYLPTPAQQNFYTCFT
eukprot:1195962-Prorocentrum_minimum.AAC.4